MRGAAWTALALAALLVAPVASAQLVGEEPAFTIADPREGDRGRYAIEDALPTPEPDEDSNASIAFHLAPQETRLDAYGRERTVWPFTLTPDPILPFDPQSEGDAFDEAWVPYTSWFPGQGLEPTMTDQLRGWSVASTSSANVAGDTQHQRSESQRTITYAHEDQGISGPECLFLSDLPGQTLSEGETVPLDGFCGENLTDRLQGTDTTLQAEATAIEERDEAPNLLSVTIQARSPDADVDLLTLTYMEEIAYPVELELHTSTAEADQLGEAWDALRGPLVLSFKHLARGDGDTRQIPHDGPISSHLRLTHFERGEGPSLPSPDPRPWPEQAPLEMGAFERWGPQAGGETVPYPLHDAAEAIMEDPEMTQFHRWLEAHPDAWVRWADYREHEADDGLEYRWSLHFVARDETTRWVQSTFDPDATGSSAPLAGDRVAVENSGGDGGGPVASDDSWGACDEGIAGPPDRAPTLHALLTLSRQAALPLADGDEPNRISWYMPSCQGSIRPSTIEAGWQLPTTDPPGVLEEPGPNRTVDEATVSVEVESGLLHEVEVFQGTRTTGQGDGSLASMSKVHPSTTGGVGPDGVDWSEVPPVVTGTAATGLLAGLLVFLAKMGLLPFYSRLTDEDLLDQDVRRALLEELEEDPGLHMAELARRVDRDSTTVDHHLRKLEDAGFLQHVGTNGTSRWFVAGQLPEEVARAEAVLSTGRTREVYQEITEQPGASLSEVADALEMHRSSTHRIVERLEEAGLVERGRSGRSVELRATG